MSGKENEENLPDTQSQRSESIPSSSSTLSQEEGQKDANTTRWGRLYAWTPPMEHYDLAAPYISLGRLETNDIIISKSKFPANHTLSISKQHFHLIKEADGPPYLIDLSKNGTFINDELVGKDNKHILQNNDIIAIGHRTLKAYVFKQLDMNDFNYLPEVLRKKYVISTLLGRGACGEVRLAYEKKTCKKTAIKKITKGTTAKVNQINHPSKIENEINILQTISHPFVMGFKEVIETEEDVFIVLDYMKGGELNSRILSQKPFSEDEVKFVFFQILLGVQYLHQNGIIHRDLKPENVLLSSDEAKPLIKISDFGLSKVIEHDAMMITICGTPNYVAPEILDPRVSRYDGRVDIWSMGVILYYMLCKKHPFDTQDKKKLGTLIMTGTIDWSSEAWSGVSCAAKDLVKKMLVVNPANRIGLEDIFSHSWIEKDVNLQVRVKDYLLSEEEKIVPYDETIFGPSPKRQRLE